LTNAPRHQRAFAAAVAALGVILVPLVLWVLSPGLPARLESTEGFCWAGVEAGTGRPLLLRERDDGREILAGSERFGVPRGELVRCYDGAAAPLLDAAQARGRIEDLALETGLFHRLTVTTDDLGGGATTYVYRCGTNGAEPLLSWGSVPGFGVRALVLASIAWLAVWLVALALVRRRR
jgi:hypothetical protein